MSTLGYLGICRLGVSKVGPELNYRWSLVDVTGEKRASEVSQKSFR